MTIKKSLSTLTSSSLLLLLAALPTAAVYAEDCSDEEQSVRSITGRCNNLLNPNWGVAWDIDAEAGGEAIADGIFGRFETAEYVDAANRVSPRDAIANPVIASTDLLRIEQDAERQWSHTNLLLVYMMQFVTHDIALTVSPPADPLALNAGLGVEQDASGRDFLLGGRSVDYLDDNGIPQQYNGASAFLDLSSTYGPTDVISNALRSFEGGLLKTVERSTFTFNHRNTPSRDICDCVDVNTGEPWNMFNEDLSNADQVFVQSAPGFIPEPFPHLGKCVSPAASFGQAFVPGVGLVPATPGVYSCPNAVLGLPPMLLENVFCAINYAAINDPSRSSFSWTVPDGIDWMPFVSETSPPVPFDELSASTNDPSKAFAAGDLRATENLGITAIQNLWLREHNRNARRIAAQQLGLTDEEIFQKARAWTIGVYQNVVMNELLPMIVGNKAYKKAGLDKPYRDSNYDPTIDPRTGNSFAAAAMRFGHSMVSNDVYPLDPETFSRIPTDQKQLPANYFGSNSPSKDAAPWIHLGAAAQSTAFAPVDEMMAFIGAQIPSGSPPDAAIIAGLVNSRAQRVDRYAEIAINDIDISNCFSGDVSISVPAFSVFRGRSHGIPSYHGLLEAWTDSSIYGRKNCPAPAAGQEYDPLACFEYIVGTDDPAYTARMRNTFKRLDLIDPFVGLTIESEQVCKHCDDGLKKGRDKRNKNAKQGIVGVTSAAIIADQFSRSRGGDRFWFENSSNGWSHGELADIRSTTLKDLIALHFPSTRAKLAGFDNVLLGKTTLN